MGKGKDAARAALFVLLQSEQENKSVYDCLRQVQRQYEGEDARLKARIEALAIGTVRHLLQVDDCLNRFSTVKTNNMKPFIRQLLRMSAYQILFSEDTPDAPVVDHAVRLCASGGFHNLKGFVNGVLRTLVREKDNVEFTSISLRYSVPEWIVERLVSQYGEEEAERICAYAQEAPALTVRTDPRPDGEEVTLIRNRIAEEMPDVRMEAHPLLPSFAYTVSGRVSPAALPGFAEGHLFVQDAGAMLAALCCGVKPGDTVVDVCAAPGGKALLLAQLMDKTGRVCAFDLSEEKCARIRENAERTHTENITVRVHDARQADESLRGKADLVLCDLPCSGLGVIARKADIRYRVQPEDIAALQKLQREILAASLSYLKEGGVLVYCTCTLTREENEDNARYIAKELGLRPDSLVPYLPEALPESSEAETAKDGYLTLLPGRFQTDGFFIARFVKQGACP